LLAGLVLNVGEAVLHGVVLAGPTAEAMTALGRSDQSSPAGLALLIGITFLQGIVGVCCTGRIRDFGTRCANSGTPIQSKKPNGLRRAALINDLFARRLASPLQ